MEPNTLLDALLDEAGMSRAGFAARINRAGQSNGRITRYDHTSVSRWMNGQRPRAQVPEIICELLSERLSRRITLDDIGMGRPDASHLAPLTGFIARATALWRSDQERADPTDTPVITGMRAIAPVWEWENPPEDRDVSRPAGPRVDAGDIAMLRTARTHYESMYRQVGGVATRARVVRFLMEHAAPLLRGSYSDQTGRNLFRATGGLAAIAGICGYDSDAQGLAQRYFHQALRLAKASSDRRFGGYVVALLVNQAVFLRDYRQAIAFAEAGLRTAGPHITPALKTDLYVMQAKAFAGLKAVTDAHRCMTLAEQTATLIRREDEPPETEYMQPGLVEAQLAEALTSLGELTPARKYAEEAVRTDTHPRGRVHRMATLTTVELNRGEVERAAASAVRMVDLAGGMESRRLRDRFDHLRRRLTQQRTAVAAEAVERIEEALSVPL
ncbi:transcriptional regulator [Plantactinospora sp. S1510]|uniref:Transcriptional regulator n=1 Tax=Plantactinospora alkalitolerans TaxID=2789879 RepID=A0ABS0GSJ5_9ACTN|nr:transcriptional regulator [Plantactinospora alkalitolerans]MBF9129029.1 transcriptional regulator [Plantactinospora alkalitolerans]